MWYKMISELRGGYEWKANSDKEQSLYYITTHQLTTTGGKTFMYTLMRSYDEYLGMLLREYGSKRASPDPIPTDEAGYKGTSQCKI